MKSDKSILERGLETLQTEIDVLQGLLVEMDKTFVSVVHKLANCKGRIVVTGIGKSALIGQKMVATFNSTGSPALFMHAADAIHGDLGMITNHDVLICISKSGETPEIKVLIPFLKNLGNPIIAFVSNKNSFLYAQADFALHIPVSKEAEPNNLAPTASTTAQLAMGDALASAVLFLKGFTASDFAKFHPGGSLGKYLYLKVGDFAQRHEQPKVSVNSPVREIIMEITSKRLGATAVLDENRLVGIITDGDLRRMLENTPDVSSIVAGDIMSPQPKCIQESELATQALQMMKNLSINQLIVLSGENYAGIIHLHDLIKEGLI